MRYGIQLATTLKDEDGDDVFKYISCDLYKEKCCPREERLRAVVYLGSTYKSRVQVEGLLDSVRVKPRMGAVRLHYWTWDAMELLSRQGAIKPLFGTAEDVWKRGAAFADTTDEPSKTRSPTGRQEIPTCNTDGGKSRMTIVPCI
ncbi:uncharacterized protein STEHIDRAFT_156044 [Stereum hirsutum FP-91666 SS1]|uniref:uncharacterized protein n=1 Tax=Stereum hirsutum (strain FP-91666) TaxID=721885 RepID=UPI000440B132|nr:uncharacterized protein STEHIDRAFT_156044 [Stereum hirsutum FP-91666 SS1]EIM87049.1 hypothetical protein STEHIDRAFT_156044 [Stereum hirsutum FP-91666 SS1]